MKIIVFIISVIIIYVFVCILSKKFKQHMYGVVPEYKNENKTLTDIHKNLKLVWFYDIQTELPEQIMTVRHLKSSDTVLELGGNIGRNSLVISSLLSNPNKQHVVVETNSKDASTLRQHSKINNLQFNILEGAISANNLIQKNWRTELAPQNGKIPFGYFKVKTCTYNDMKDMYNIDFNTIIADCEGCILHLLRDFPEMLHNIEKIILEHDFSTLQDYDEFKNILKINNFEMVDYLLKTDPHCPGNSWKGGLLADDIFISVWYKT